jgi:hypothetical protein
MGWLGPHRLLLAVACALAWPSIAAAQEPAWEILSALPTPRRLLAAAADGGRIYTFGGCGSPCFQPPFHTSTFEETRVEVYDPATDTWSVRAPMPTIVFGAATAAPGNGRIYLVGGQLTGNLTQEYDPATDRWTLKAPMPTPRYGLAAVALGGRVYALGGSGPSAAVEVYDPATDRWSARAPLPTPRVFLAAAVLDGRIWALGGSPDCCGGSRTAAVEVYDPAADRWTAAPPLPVAQQLSAAAVLDGRLYALGGFVPGQGAQGGSFAFDPATGAWAPGPALPRARDQAPAVAVGSCGHLLGGASSCHCQALADHHCLRDLPTPAEGADLAVTLSDGVARICPGQPLTYRIEVVNHGPATVEGARLRDGFPGALGGVTWSCVAAEGASCGAAAGAGPIDQRVDLPAGGSVTYTADGAVSPGFCGRLVNVATVDPPPGVPDPEPANNRAEDADAPRPVNLGIGVSNGVDRLTAGEPATYSLAVENLGECPAPARVRDLFPPELTGVGWTCEPSPEADCAAAGQGDLDDRAFVPRGGRLTYTATGVVTTGAGVSPPGGGTLCNTATVETACDAEPADDRATDCDPIAPCRAELAIAAVAPAVSATAGAPVHYGWVVTNLGAEAVAGAAVRAEPPPVFAGDPVWSCAPAARCSPAAGTGAIAVAVDLAPGESVTFTVAGALRPGLFCTFIAFATVAPPTGCLDGEAGDDRAAVELTVFPPPPGLGACKTVRGDLRPGGLVRYRIVLLNPGPFDQADNPGPELVDALPAAFAGLAATATSGDLQVDARTLIWNGAVPAGETVTLELTATIAGGATGDLLCNRGKLFSDPDGDGFNDHVTTTDDPALGGELDPTCFTVLGPQEIPTLPATGLVALVLLLAAVGVGLLRRGG